MISILQSIAQFIFSICEFLINTFRSILWVINAIPSFVGSITAVFAYCPSPLLVFLEISLALTVLFAVIKLL